ncbi:MAG: hypothetical protein K0S58_1674 [Nitrospira sp.]|nr:hypothetical protein [Nitrospira sp.]
MCLQVWFEVLSRHIRFEPACSLLSTKFILRSYAA